MKTPIILLALAADILVSCQQQASKQAATATDTLTTAAPAEEKNTTHCYIKVVGRDTIQLSISFSDSIATGALLYNFFEKDKNTGKFNGVLHNGIIRGKYTFFSEGVESSRPAIFKISGQQAYEALPESMDRLGQPVFNLDNDKLKFDSIPLVAGQCK